jgi:hypothetical protein
VAKIEYLDISTPTSTPPVRLPTSTVDANTGRVAPDIVIIDASNQPAMNFF